jgi:hypothetical protein
MDMPFQAKRGAGTPSCVVAVVVVREDAVTQILI